MQIILSIALGTIVILAYTIRLLVQAIKVRQQTISLLTKERDAALSNVEMVLENEQRELGRMSVVLEMVLNGT